MLCLVCWYCYGLRTEAAFVSAGTSMCMSHTDRSPTDPNLREWFRTTVEERDGRRLPTAPGAPSPKADGSR